MAAKRQAAKSALSSPTTSKSRRSQLGIHTATSPKNRRAAPRPSSSRARAVELARRIAPRITSMSDDTIPALLRRQATQPHAQAVHAGVAARRGRRADALVRGDAAPRGGGGARAPRPRRLARPARRDAQPPDRRLLRVRARARRPRRDQRQPQLADAAAGDPRDGRGGGGDAARELGAARRRRALLARAPADDAGGVARPARERHRRGRPRPARARRRRHRPRRVERAGARVHPPARSQRRRRDHVHVGLDGDAKGGAIDAPRAAVELPPAARAAGGGVRRAKRRHALAAPQLPRDRLHEQLPLQPPRRRALRRAGRRGRRRALGAADARGVRVHAAHRARHGAVARRRADPHPRERRRRGGLPAPAAVHPRRRLRAERGIAAARAAPPRRHVVAPLWADGARRTGAGRRAGWEPGGDAPAARRQIRARGRRGRRGGRAGADRDALGDGGLPARQQRPAAAGVVGGDDGAALLHGRRLPAAARR